MGNIDWLPIEDPPAASVGVLLYYPDAKIDDGTPIGSDYRIRVGWYDAACVIGPVWREQGTNHDCFESWAVESGHIPTYWAEINPPGANPGIPAYKVRDATDDVLGKDGE